MSEMNMVERVARALCKQAGYGIGEEDWPVYVGAARAAIEAMREPTRRMISEGESAASQGLGKANDDEALPRVWRDMIDEALKERP